MSYEPTNWKTGDVVTSAKLNKLEQGVANGSIMVVSENESVLNKTAGELFEAFINMIPIYRIKYNEVDEQYTMDLVASASHYTSDGDYYRFGIGKGNYEANSSDEYPHYGLS